jgi:tRNA threonylcarbamoyladenosine biosynthesis protein TsaB
VKLLTIDTSTSTCSVAVTIGTRLVSEFLLDLERTLAARLLRSVDATLRAAGLTVTDLDGIGLALGPGSFTGLRIGAATVKGLALAAGKPVTGFSSLAMLAMNLPIRLSGPAHAGHCRLCHPSGRFSGEA